MIKQRLWALFALFSLIGLLACSKHYFHANSVEYEGVTVQPMEIWTGGSKLWVRAMVTNSGTQPILVNRDAIVARLPSGMVVGRATGKTSVHDVYFIPAGMSHPVYIEFREAGFDWDSVGEASIDFSAGVTRDGQHVPLHMSVVP